MENQQKELSPMNAREQLAALNNRPATVTIFDADGSEVSVVTCANQAQAQAVPVPEGHTRTIVIDANDLA
jgi:hypothetical protein